MKLAIVTETFPPEVNGVAMTFERIVRGLGRRGHLVSVYRPRRNDLPNPDSHPEFQQFPVPGMPIPGYPLLRLGLPAGGLFRASWTRDRPDLVHVATEGPLGISAIRAARRLGIPVTSSFHTNFHFYARHYRIGPLRHLALAWLRQTHNLTRLTFVPTEESMSQLRHLGFRRLALLSRGVDSEQFTPDRRSDTLRAFWGAAPDDPVVVHVGRMAAEKNYPLLFEAYAAMRAANPDCRFVLAGEGPLKKALRKRHPECIFAGFFSRDEIGRYYASADIYVHASLTETFGNVLTEAMASGLSIAGFDYAAARLFVRHQESGLLADCARPADLIAAAVRLATDRVLRQRVRLAARQSVARQSWDSVVAQFEVDLIAALAPAQHSGLEAPAAA